MAKLTEEQKLKKQQEKDEKYAEKALVEDITQIYFRDIREQKREPLTAERERELAELIRQGNQNAKNELIEAHLLMVPKIVDEIKKKNEFNKNKFPLEDAIQAGNEGLIRAAKEFDSAKKVRFSTYAEYWIRKMIYLTLDNERSIHIPDHILRCLRLLASVRNEISDCDGRQPSVSELTEAIKKLPKKSYMPKTITEDFIKELLQIESMQPDSFNKPIEGEGEDAITLGERFSNKNAGDFEIDMLNALDEDSVFEVMKYIGDLNFEDPQVQELYELMMHAASATQINKFAKKFTNEQMEVFRKKIVEKSKVTWKSESIAEKREIDYQPLSKEEKLLKRLSSGETTQLMQSQDAYARIFSDSEGYENEDIDQCWELEVCEEEVNGKIVTKFSKEDKFLEEIEKIQSVAPEKYVLRYLLDYYNLDLMLENGKLCIAAVSECLKTEYKEAGFEIADWKKYFTKLLTDLDDQKLNQLALVTKMDIQMYLTFRTKVLKCKDYDFLSKEFIWMYLILKYGVECGQLNYKTAYDKLEMLYGDEQIDEASLSNIREQGLESSQAIGKKILLDIETTEGLKPEFREHLFEERIEPLFEIFCMIKKLENAQILRSDEEILKRQWKELMVNITHFEDEWLSDHLKGKSEEQDYELTKADVYRFLYGANSTKLQDKTLKNKNFLSSQVFEDSQIDNNAFTHFGNKSRPGHKKRTMLLTLIFLNYTYYLDEKDKGKSMEYFERIHLFEYRVWEILSSCGYMMLHSENAYDSFLKLLLSCSEPRTLFRYVWENREELIEKCIGEKEKESL